MSGLNLGVMGGVKAGTGTGYATSAPASATQAGFGPGYTQAGAPSDGSCLAPNDGFGLALWSGVIALGLLLLIRHSLPS